MGTSESSSVMVNRRGSSRGARDEGPAPVLAPSGLDVVLSSFKTIHLLALPQTPVVKE